jgi:hypothetical protein
MSDNASKHDQRKIPMHLIPPESVFGEAAIFGLGALKYGVYQWTKGTGWSRFFGAALRHLYQWWSRSDVDDESRLSHLYHLRCCVSILIAYQERRLGVDDRPEGVVVDLLDQYPSLMEIWSEQLDGQQKTDTKIIKRNAGKRKL